MNFVIKSRICSDNIYSEPGTTGCASPVRRMRSLEDNGPLVMEFNDVVDCWLGERGRGGVLGESPLIVWSNCTLGLPISFLILLDLFLLLLLVF